MFDNLKQKIKDYKLKKYYEKEEKRLLSQKFPMVPGREYSPAVVKISPVDGKMYVFPPRRNPTTETLLWRHMRPYLVDDKPHYRVYGPLDVIKPHLEQFFKDDPTLLAWECDFLYPDEYEPENTNKGLCAIQWYEDGIHHMETIGYHRVVEHVDFTPIDQEDRDWVPPEEDKKE